MKKMLSYINLEGTDKIEYLKNLCISKSPCLFIFPGKYMEKGKILTATDIGIIGEVSKFCVDKIPICLSSPIKEGYGFRYVINITVLEITGIADVEDGIVFSEEEIQESSNSIGKIRLVGKIWIEEKRQ